jgi:hypothetical protein
MVTETVTGTPQETLRELLGAADAESVQYFLDPPLDFLFALAEIGESIEGLPEIRVIGRHEALRQFRQDFLMGSRIADLVADGSVSLRETELSEQTPMVVGDGRLNSLVLVEDVATAIETDEPSFLPEAVESCAELWENAEEYRVRTPPLGDLLVSIREDLGPEFERGFQASLDVAQGLRDRTQFHEVKAALVVAAENEMLHYDVSKWGEDSGLASTASFSRHKSKLEEDVIDTEKQPVEMGRPRQRLKLTDEYRTIADEEGIENVIARVAA